MSYSIAKLNHIITTNYHDIGNGEFFDNYVWIAEHIRKIFVPIIYITLLNYVREKTQTK